MNIPSEIRAGDTVTWRDEAARDNLGGAVSSTDYTLTYWLRTNHNHEGTSAVGTTYGSGWQFSISAATTAGFEPGNWFWQAIASKAGSVLTLGAGQLTVQPALSFAGLPDAFDGRTQAQKDLDAVQAAVRAMISGGAVAEYSIGSRRLKKMELADLLALESSLKAEVKREQKAALIANGLGNPHNLFVRF